MQEKWIEHNLSEIINNPLIEADILKSYESFLTGVSKNGKKIEIFKLTKDAKQLKDIKL